MKRILSIMLSVLIVISICLTADAAEVAIAVSGDGVVISDENWTYEKIKFYGWKIDKYIGADAEVKLPWTFAKEYITAVGDYAFDDDTTVTSVKTSGVLETIGDYAFNGCSSLDNIILFDALTTLGVGCFYGCSSLTDINLADSAITSVPAYCFAECGFSELELPATCTSIGNMSFYNCSSLKKITIPDSVTEIHEDAFKGSDNVTIYCYTDSYAHQYAEANDIKYVLVDGSIEYTFILGDADGNGVVTILDATVIQRVLVLIMDDPDGMIELRAAVDGDELNITHATKIQRYLADFGVPEPIGSEVTRFIPASTQG
ncbi:MAG: leucine-rich repeat protein [Ruminococcus sp.]|nr:leucine-rich repeat protein [Ruminococcus sp.]